MTCPASARRSAFESVFLGAVRLARVLAADLGRGSDGGAEAGSITGTGASIVVVLALSVRVPLAELAIANGLFPGLAGVVKTLAVELGPAGIRINGLLPVRIATDRIRELDALRGDPDEVRARLSEHIPLRRSHLQTMGVPVAAVRSANRAVRRLVTGPGWPSPMVRPSTRTTGARPPMVPVTNASSAV
jgi:NAD(P)-dependent dehydrogenase (short-subunit alcohol dehydrogenase family)